ncbi:MAG: phosphoglycerate dehydrogenase-like enzyme [Kiritimatiellia bacterium]
MLRWGRSAYETDAALAEEQGCATALGLGWELRPMVNEAPDEPAHILVVTSKANVCGSVLDAVRPSMVLTTTSGYEHIDLEACRARGIVAARSPMARRDAVVEHSIEALVRLLRRLPEQERAAHRDHWSRADLRGLAPRGLAGSTIVLVGLGVIGQRMAQLLDLMGARVIGVDPFVEHEHIEQLPLHEAIPQADAVSLHASSSPSSRGLFDAKLLRELPRNCVLINTARGDLLDPDAAAQLVRQGHLSGLACDVFPQEPYPRLAQWAADNILLTPHASGYTHDLGHRVADSVGRALSAWVAERPVPWRLV